MKRKNGIMKAKDFKFSGFTLIELLVVIAIIGLLSTLAITALGTTRLKSRDARRASDLKQIQTALELFASNNNGAYPVTTSISLGDTTHACLGTNGFGPAGGCTGQFISLPKDPANGFYSYSSNDGSSYAVQANLEGNLNGLSGPVSVTSNSGLTKATAVTITPLIPDDAKTVAHVWWNGTALVDSKGNSWAMQGAVPQVPSSSSAGFFKQPRAGAGPFTSTTYYSLGSSGNNPLNITGDFSVCAVFNLAGYGSSYHALIGDGQYTAASTDAGWFLYLGPGGHPALDFWGQTGNNHLASAPIVTLGVVTLVCGGRAGFSTYLAQMTSSTSYNGGTILSGYTPATTPAVIGAGYGSATNGTFYEMWVSTTTPSLALFTSIQQAVFNPNN